MENLEIFDKNGNRLCISDVIYNFIDNIAKESCKDITDILVGVHLGYVNGEPTIWITTTEAINNGYDATDLVTFGNEIKVNCI